MDFRIVGLPAARFAPLFALPEAELASHRAVRRIADSKPGFPCRVSLEDAEPGEQVILVHHEHHPVDTPYRASHAIYVRGWATKTFDRVNEVPPALRTRLLSVRAFDAAGMMVEADVTEGRELERLIERMLAVPRTVYLHVHFAKAGCYAACVTRAEPATSMSENGER